MKRILCIALCIVMLLSAFALSACNTFYTGDELANDKKQDVVDYFSNFDYSKMSNYRVDTIVSASFDEDADKNTKMTGYAIFNELEEVTLEYYEMAYKSSQFSFKLKVWCDGTNCYFEETFKNQDGELVRNKFYHTVEMDGYAQNMQNVRRHFNPLDVDQFCGYLAVCDLYGKGNNYYLKTQWDLFPTTAYVSLSANSYRTKTERRMESQTEHYLISTTMQKTLQNVNMPNLENVAEGYLSTQILDILF